MGPNILYLHQTRTIFEKYGIPIPGEDFAVNPKRNITVVVDDDEAKGSNAGTMSGRVRDPD